MLQKINSILLEQIKASLLLRFPSMKIAETSGKVFIRGNFPVKAEGKILDYFQLEIELPSDYPESVPKVIETGGRIPKIADRHVNGLDNSFCVFLADERWKYYPEGSTVINFMEGPLTQFLWNQIYFESTGKWLNGERGHGVNGVVEYYFEELQTKNLQQVLEFLKYLSKGVIKGHKPCWCGSDKKLRECHITKLKDLKTKVPKNVARKSLNQIAKMVGKSLF